MVERKKEGDDKKEKRRREDDAAAPVHLVEKTDRAGNPS
jgi:hypothetical protein